MIIDFSIKNFGSIRDEQTLSFEADSSSHLEDHYIINHPSGLRLLKLALIYGPNASGKTTILNALEFFRQIALNPPEKKTDELNFEPFLFDAETPGSESVISMNFIQNNVKYFYKVAFSRKAVLREELYFFDPKKAKLFTRTTDVDNQFSKITFGTKIKVDKTFEKTLESNTLWNGTVLGGYLKTNIELNELKEVTAWFHTYLRPIITTDTNLSSTIAKRIEESIIDKSLVISILKKADFNISGIEIDSKVEMPEHVEKIFKALNITQEKLDSIKKDPPRRIIFEHTVDGNKYSLPMNLESEGTMRYFGFAGVLSLLIKRSIAVYIDELESSLHPDLYMHFILSFLINSKQSQLIATTHLREMLDNKELFRNDAIWFTDKPERGATLLYSLADFDSSVVRDSTNVLNAYKSGKLRATPNLGDYYIETKP